MAGLDRGTPRGRGARVRAHALAGLKRLAYAAGEPLARRASRAYVPGPQLQDAVRWGHDRAPPGAGFTFGYFNGDGEPAAQVEAASGHAIAALAQLAARQGGLTSETSVTSVTGLTGSTGLTGYCSVKPPALAYDPAALERLAAQAAQHGQWLHVDSHGPETAEPTLAALEALRSRHTRLSLTLPGRWARSLRDAEWAAERALRVRVVKGQWPCPLRPEADPRAGFLAVIDRLAGQVAEVAVATHDADLARQAVRRLAARGTACELELLCGLPRRAAMALAHAERLPVRLYVPFGQAWLPYALQQVLRQPRLWPRLLRDSLAEAWQPGA